MLESNFESGLGKKTLVLIKAVFKVADKVSDESIKNRIKELALEIFDNLSVPVFGESLTGVGADNLLIMIDNLSNLLYFSHQLNLVEEKTLRILSNAFTILKSEVIINSYKKEKSPQPSVKEKSKGNISKEIKTTALPKETTKESEANSELLNLRQNRIVNFLKENQKAKLHDIMTIFSGLNPRTIRKDLNFLCKISKIKNSGWGGSSYYEIIQSLGGLRNK